MFDFQFYLYNFTKLLAAHCHNERKLVANAKQWLCKRSHFIPRNSHHHCAHPPRPRPLHCPFTAIQGRLLFTFQIYHGRKAHTRITQCVALAKTHPLWMPRLLHWSIRAAPSCRHTLMDARSSRNCVRAKRAPWLSTHKDIGVHIRFINTAPTTPNDVDSIHCIHTLILREGCLRCWCGLFDCAIYSLRWMNGNATTRDEDIV